MGTMIIISAAVVLLVAMAVIFAMMLKSARAEKEQALALLRETHDAAVSGLKSGHEAAVNSLKEGYERTLDEMKSGHKREVAKEDTSGGKLTGRLVNKTNANLHVGVISNRSVLTLLYGISGSRIDCVVGKLDGQISGIIHDGRYVAENLVKSFSEEPLVRVLLHLNKIRHFCCCFNL